MAEDAAAAVTEDRPALNVTLEDSGPARKTLTLEIPEERIQEKIESSYTTLSDDAVLPGFRKGRAPRRLLEKRYAESVRTDVKSQLISEAYSQAIEEHELDVLGEPEPEDGVTLETLELPESGSMTIKLSVEITPEVDLPDFSTLEVERKYEAVTDEKVSEELENLCNRFGQSEVVEGATIEADDYVLSDVKVLAGENAGEDADVLAEQEGAYVLVAGESREFKGHVLGILIQDLGKQLLGKTGGESVSISMTGPESHENDKIKGQPITVQLALRAVERLTPATMEQVVEKAGVESEDELKERVTEGLTQRAEQQSRADLYAELRKKLVEPVELELPEGVTGRQADRLLQRRRMELMYRGVSAEMAEAELALMRTNSDEEARTQLKEFFVLDKASKDLNIEVGENELNTQIVMMAQQQGRRPEKMRQELASRGQLEQLYLQIREQKTLDKVLEQAKVTGDPLPSEAEAEAATDDTPAGT